MATVPDIPVIINWSVTPQNGEENYFDLMNTWLTESTTVVKSLSDAVDAMNVANPLVYESGKAAVAAANYQGIWDNAFAGGYGKYTTVTYSDGYIYISEIDNNTAEPTSKTNTSEWTWFINADPDDFYTKSEVYTKTELNNGQLDNRYYTESESNNIFVNKDFITLSEKATPVDNDILPINDSENSNLLKKLTFANLLNWLKSFILGWGQTWQNVTGSRSAGVTYTNTTGKPIQLAITTLSNGYISINGSQVQRSDSASWSTHNLIIPNNSTYLVQSGLTIDKWWELR